MYLYQALINALGTHIIHIILNIIFYIHVEHSPINNNLHSIIFIQKHTHPHPHPHTPCNEFERA